MKSGINPKVDCVFKAIFGSEENKDVLIHLLNAVITPEPDHLIASVELLNPYNDREFDGGRSSIVDIKAKDQMDRNFQIEIQIQAHPGLQERILWTWTDIYHRQLQKGQKYKMLNPTISIWFMDESLFVTKDQYHHRFAVMERARKELLTDHFDLHVIEMQKWTSRLTTQGTIDLWLKFLNYGQDLEAEKLPEELRIPEIQKAMSTLTRFSQSDKEHDLYMRRLEYLSVESSWKGGLEDAQKERDLAMKERDIVQKEKDIVQKEKDIVQKEKDIVQKEKDIVQKERDEAQREVIELRKALELARKAQKPH
jgi:predicted transposase/invertase (TIGR01784 family)